MQNPGGPFEGSAVGGCLLGRTKGKPPPDEKLSDCVPPMLTSQPGTPSALSPIRPISKLVESPVRSTGMARFRVGLTKMAPRASEASMRAMGSANPQSSIFVLPHFP